MISELIMDSNACVVMAASTSSHGNPHLSKCGSISPLDDGAMVGSIFSAA